MTSLESTLAELLPRFWCVSCGRSPGYCSIRQNKMHGTLETRLHCHGERFGVHARLVRFEVPIMLLRESRSAFFDAWTAEMRRAGYRTEPMTPERRWAEMEASCSGV